MSPDDLQSVRDVLAKALAPWVARSVGRITEPFLAPTGEVVVRIGVMRYALRAGVEGYLLEKAERNDSAVEARFRRLDEAVKYLLWRAGDSTREQAQLRAKDLDWWDEGLAPGVEIAEDGYARIVQVSGDADSRTWLPSKYEAVSFSHAMTLSLGALSGVLQAGLPLQPA